MTDAERVAQLVLADVGLMAFIGTFAAVMTYDLIGYLIDKARRMVERAFGYQRREAFYRETFGDD